MPDFSVNKQVIANLRKRAEERGGGLQGSQLKTCLVVQGGGMRASYSMGSLLALEEMGLTNAFDVVIGSSAGAINGAYFVAGQAKIATEVYSEYITNKRFINLFRWNQIMDVDYLVGRLSSGKSSLDLKKIIESGVDLRFKMI